MWRGTSAARHWAGAGPGRARAGCGAGRCDGRWGAVCRGLARFVQSDSSTVPAQNRLTASCGKSINRCRAFHWTLFCNRHHTVILGLTRRKPRQLLTLCICLHLPAPRALPLVRRAGNRRRRCHPGPKAAMTLRIAGKAASGSRWSQGLGDGKRHVPVRRSVAARGGYQSVVVEP